MRWIPNYSDGGDEKQWSDNFETLLNQIKTEYSISTDDIELQQAHNKCDIGDGEDLMEVWQNLVDDDMNHIMDIVVICATQQSESEEKQSSTTAFTIHDKAMPVPSCLIECNLDQLISLLRNNELFNDSKINQFKDKIISYLRKNDIDGEKLSKIPRKTFSESLIRFCDNTANDNLFSCKIAKSLCGSQNAISTTFLLITANESS